MYHPTFNSYDDEININKKYTYKTDMKRETANISNLNECLICWDSMNVYKLQTFAIITTKCKCNSTFHRKCLFKWVYETNSCPICRKSTKFNIKLLDRILNKNQQNNNIGEFIEYNIENSSKLKYVLFITLNIIRQFIKFIVCLFFYASLFTFVIIVKEVSNKNVITTIQQE